MTEIDENFKFKYLKNKNSVLFESFQHAELANMLEIQNYIPFYERLFVLNETNYDQVNFPSKLQLYSLQKRKDEENPCVFHSLFVNDAMKHVEKTIFCKYSPLVDPIKYMMGKYDVQENLDKVENMKSIFVLPKLSNHSEVHPKLLDLNNCAYVDGFFTFLSSQLFGQGFVHAIDFYGLYLGIQKDHMLDIGDDIEFLNQSEYFNKNMGTLFTVDDLDKSFQKHFSCKFKERLQFGNVIEDDENILELEEVSCDLFDTVFEKCVTQGSDMHNICPGDELTPMEIDANNEDTISLHDSCSRSTSSGSLTSNECDSDPDDTFSEYDEDDVKEATSDDDECTSESSSECSDEVIVTKVHKFPVQIIAMEHCDNTLDDYIEMQEEEEYEISIAEWTSILMQIIMTLICYQKVFSFTHNDLHTNNIMYVETDKKFLYYCYDGNYYKVPTFGKIYKIIDFGRSIYKVRDEVFCSDCFSKGEDAYTQYNTEPYLDDNKARLEPNMSFDLCRLACSLFDFFVDDMDDVEEVVKQHPIAALIDEWCRDDKKRNVLYKRNGDDRYPDFKLYKMIARTVHQHTPQAQLEREMFSAFRVAKKKIDSSKIIMNLDNIQLNF